MTTNKRGHYPKGKRRHPTDTNLLCKLRAGLRRATKHRRMRSIARAMYISDRTIRRWRDGVDQPTDSDCRHAIFACLDLR